MDPKRPILRKYLKDERKDTQVGVYFSRNTLILRQGGNRRVQVGLNKSVKDFWDLRLHSVHMKSSAFQSFTIIAASISFRLSRLEKNIFAKCSLLNFKMSVTYIHKKIP